MQNNLRKRENFGDPQDILVLAQTIYGEARGEINHLEGGLAALIAVGNVVINRLDGMHTIEQVCKRPWQFSCWNPTDPNFSEIEKATGKRPTEFLTCLGVSEGLLLMNWPDLTNSATHYYSCYMKTPPYWAENMKIQVKIGHHLFLKEKEH
ncbi:MAG: cell wall hydrolase [Holosporales bacterium]|jgi:spore germination cell wall hydrolase CwlJ-like protein|nr:cell wall hydrolase [Holosporales bacterium]